MHLSHRSSCHNRRARKVKSHVIPVRISAPLRALIEKATQGPISRFIREATELALLEPCHRCSSRPTLSKQGASCHVICDECYDGAPDSGTRGEYGCGRTRDEAIKEWNEKMGEM